MPPESAEKITPPLCKCGRGPWRKGQRNCLACNREANSRYRKSLKKPLEWGRAGGSPWNM